mgnify:CR=1 FL=1
MGAESTRRFHGGGRPHMAQAPLPPRDAPNIQQQSKRKNEQRRRRRQELRAQDDAEGALDEALQRLITGPSADVARALARMFADPKRRIECGQRCALPPLVAACLSVDAEVAAPCCLALARLFTGAAELQAQAVEAGCPQALVTCLQTHSETSLVVVASCRALERMAVGVGAAARRDAAAEAGALPTLVSAVRRWVADESASAACRAALRSLTRDSGRLQEAAVRAGADLQWLL